MLSDHKTEKLFWAKVEKTGSCWLWTASRTGRGYGEFWIGRRAKKVAAHRYSYESFKGPIPKGLVIDHLCRVRSCVRPDHLEAVSNKENVLRGVGPSAVHAVKTECKNGHLYNEKNTIKLAKQRRCRICHRASVKKRYWRLKAIAALSPEDA